MRKIFFSGDVVLIVNGVSFNAAFPVESHKRITRLIRSAVFWESNKAEDEVETSGRNRSTNETIFPSILEKFEKKYFHVSSLTTF